MNKTLDNEFLRCAELNMSYYACLSRMALVDKLCNPSYRVIFQAIAWVLVVAYATRRLPWPSIRMCAVVVAICMAYVITAGNSSMTDCEPYGLTLVYMKVLQIGAHPASDVAANREVKRQLVEIRDFVLNVKWWASWHAIAVLAAVALASDLILLAQDKLQRWWTSPSGGSVVRMARTVRNARGGLAMNNANVLTAADNKGTINIVSCEYYTTGGQGHGPDSSDDEDCVGVVPEDEM
jgi:hypothetical protein